MCTCATTPKRRHITTATALTGLLAVVITATGTGLLIAGVLEALGS